MQSSPSSALLDVHGSGKDVNHQDSFGNTALMIAANQGDFFKVKTLLEAKADVNKQDKYGQTALVFAAFSGYQDIVRAHRRHSLMQIKCALCSHAAS